MNFQKYNLKSDLSYIILTMNDDNELFWKNMSFSLLPSLSLYLSLTQIINLRTSTRLGT